jgi:hypothetical protein
MDQEMDGKNPLLVFGALVEEVHEAGDQVRVRQVEQGVQHVDAPVRQLDELVRVEVLDLGAETVKFG